MANETNPPKDKGKGPAEPVDLESLRAQVHTESEDDMEGGSFLNMGQAGPSQRREDQQPSGSNLPAPLRGRNLESHTIEAEDIDPPDEPRPIHWGRNAATATWLEKRQNRSHQLLSQRVNAVNVSLNGVTQAIRDMQAAQKGMHIQLLNRLDQQREDISKLADNQQELAGNQQVISEVIDSNLDYHDSQFTRLQAQLNEHLPAKEGRRVTFDFTNPRASRRSARLSLNRTDRPFARPESPPNPTRPESPFGLAQPPPVPRMSQLDPGEGSSRSPPAAAPQEEAPNDPQASTSEPYPSGTGPTTTPETSSFQHGLQPSVNPETMAQSPRIHQGHAGFVDHSAYGQSIRFQQLPSTTAEEANRRYFQMAYGPGLFQQQTQQPQHQQPQQQYGQQMPPAAFPTLGRQQTPRISQYERQLANLHHLNQPVHPEQWLARNSATPTFAAHQVPAFNPMLHVQQQQQQAGPEAFGGSGSSTSKLKREDVGVFEPFHPNPEDLGCVTKGKNVIFTDSYAFETRLMSFLLDPNTAAANEKQLKELFPTLLTGAAVIWWNTEVPPFVQSHMYRSGLAAMINAVKQRFAPNRIEASVRFNQGHLTLKDIAANENALSQYITKKMRYARIIGITTENGQNWFGAMMQIWTSLGNDVKPYLRAPNCMEFMGD